MRSSVSPATPLKVEQVAVSETDASLMASTTAPMASANSVIASSIVLRRAWRFLLPACRCSVIAFATSKLMTCDMARPRSADLGGRKSVFAGERVERRLEHVTPGGAADARVETESRFLLDGVPAQFGIAFLEIAAEQRREMRRFELFEEISVLRDDSAHYGQRAYGTQNFVDGPIQIGRDQRPSFPHQAAGARIQTVQRKPRFK